MSELNVTLDETEELVVTQPKQEEAAELVLIEQNVTLDPANKNVKIRYPAKGDLTQLQDNRGQAIGCAVSLERKLSKDKTREIYNAEFLGYVERELFKELTQDEMRDWD